MSAETEQAGTARAPTRWLRRIDIRVKQEDNESPTSARPRFAWNMGEVSGSLGDLGTFLPHIVGAITVVKMDPTGILTTFGLFYAFTGAFYGVPMAVQPMKAASAAVLIGPMDPAAIAGAGLVIGAVFLILGVTGVVSRLARALPGSIAAGLQLGLGMSLAGLGIRLIETQIWLGLAISALMLGLMRYQRWPVALVAVLASFGAAEATSQTDGTQLYLPSIVPGSDPLASLDRVLSTKNQEPRTEIDASVLGSPMVLVVDQFEELLEQSEHQPLVFSLALHGFIVGQPFRLRPLRQAIKHCVEHKHNDRVWYTRAGDIANYCFSLPKGVIPGS